MASEKNVGGVGADADAKGASAVDEAKGASVVDEAKDTKDAKDAKDAKDKQKKSVLLRISPALYEGLSRFAEDEFRSLNGQIEYLLTEAVKKKYGKGYFKK